MVMDDSISNHSASSQNDDKSSVEEGEVEDDDDENALDPSLDEYNPEVIKYKAAIRCLSPSLRCTCCGDVYSDPVILPRCKHMINRDCANGARRNGHSVTCPMCKLRNRVDNVDDLPTNYDVAMRIPPKPNIWIVRMNKQREAEAMASTGYYEENCEEENTEEVEGDCHSSGSSRSNHRRSRRNKSDSGSVSSSNSSSSKRRARFRNNESSSSSSSSDEEAVPVPSRLSKLEQEQLARGAPVIMASSRVTLPPTASRVAPSGSGSGLLQPPPVLSGTPATPYIPPFSSFPSPPTHPPPPPPPPLPYAFLSRMATSIDNNNISRGFHFNPQPPESTVSNSSSSSSSLCNTPAYRASSSVDSSSRNGMLPDPTTLWQSYLCETSTNMKTESPISTVFTPSTSTLPTPTRTTFGKPQNALFDEAAFKSWFSSLPVTFVDVLSETQLRKLYSNYQMFLLQHRGSGITPADLWQRFLSESCNHESISEDPSPHHDCVSQTPTEVPHSSFPNGFQTCPEAGPPLRMSVCNETQNSMFPNALQSPTEATCSEASNCSFRIAPQTSTVCGPPPRKKACSEVLPTPTEAGSPLRKNACPEVPNSFFPSGFKSQVKCIELRRYAPVTPIRPGVTVYSTVCIGNLPPYVCAQDIFALLRQYGTVECVRMFSVVVDTRPVIVSLTNMRTEAAVERCVATLNGSHMFGRAYALLVEKMPTETDGFQHAEPFMMKR